MTALQLQIQSEDQIPVPVSRKVYLSFKGLFWFMNLFGTLGLITLIYFMINLEFLHTPFDIGFGSTFILLETAGLIFGFTSIYNSVKTRSVQTDALEFCSLYLVVLFKTSALLVIAIGMIWRASGYTVFIFLYAAICEAIVTKYCGLMAKKQEAESKAAQQFTTSINSGRNSI